VCADCHITLGVHEFQSLIAALKLTPSHDHSRLTAANVGAPDLETDLHVHKCKPTVPGPLSSHDTLVSWETTWRRTHVPKPLPTFTVHISCISMGTHCTQLLRGHSLYARVTAWALLVH